MLEGGNLSLSSVDRRLRQGRRGEGGAKHAAGGGGGGRGGGTELNNLHPAWRPKALSRRQRAVSVVENS